MLLKPFRALTKIAARARSQRMSPQEQMATLHRHSQLLNYLQLNKTSLTFFNSQISHLNLGEEGICTLKDKILALSIRKQSGKAYRHLKKIFLTCHQKKYYPLY